MMRSDPAAKTQPTPAGSNNSRSAHSYDGNGFCSSETWTRVVNQMRAPITKAVRVIAVHSATYPISTIAAVVLFSVGILVIGVVTNFSVDVDEDVLWTPVGSHPVNNMNWINDKSGFPLSPRTMLLLFHEDGDDNVLSKDFVRQSFTALDAVVTLPDYAAVCTAYPNSECEVSGFLKFWNNSLAIFDASVSSDQDIIDALAQVEFPDGTPVALDGFVGNVMFDGDNVVGAHSFSVYIDLPEDRNDLTTTQDFEKKALDAVFEVKKKLEQGSTFRLETIADRSFQDEFGRAIINDIPLVPVVFIVMSVFTSAIFFKKNRIHARSTLGFMSVISILLSIMAGYGLMFVCGVPFTSMTQILPFVFFGVGLDDSFIITGSFFRMDPKRDVIERMGETMDEIGLSIFLTTLTSCLAFGLGCISSIPAVFWLCVYATPTMAFILLWQLTFFIGCLTIDEQRVAAMKGDGIRRFIHCSKQSSDETDDKTTTETKDSMIDQLMVQYAHFILKPWVKAMVIVAFLALAAACSVSTSTLRQAFTFTDVLPGDSYITPFFEALNDYTGGSSVFPAAYFRNEDQSDPAVRAQMETFVNELVSNVAAVGNKQPDFCWFRDFDVFVAVTEGLDNQSFTEQLKAFLADDVYNHLYRDNIVLDDQGSIVTSRCFFTMDGVDFEDIKKQIQALEEQLQVTERQPINKGKSEFSFFTYESSYNIWAFYAQSAKEIVLTTISSIASVIAVTLLLVPHWSASVFVTPLISILYIDLLGVMQWAGIRVNPVSYITLVMSIGLLVDFLLHVLLRYYECRGNRHDKIVEMLRTMGSSVLIGGITTFLGTLPLAFSTSDIFSTVFIAFLALVSLGATHGLILLPVMLSLFGPEVHISLATTIPTTASKSSNTVEPATKTVDLIKPIDRVVAHPVDDNDDSDEEVVA